MNTDNEAEKSPREIDGIDCLKPGAITISAELKSWAQTVSAVFVAS